MVANILPAAPPIPLPPTLGGGGQNSTFSENGHVAYQIKGNRECTNMVANICPQPPPSPSPQKVKIQLFQNMVMLYTKGNRECSNMVATADRGTINTKHIKRDFDPRPVSDPLGGLRGRDQNSTFSEHGHVAYQIKGNHGCSNMVANILPANPLPSPPPDPGGQKVKIHFLQNIIISNLIDSRMQKRGSKYSAHIPSPTPTRPWGRVKRSKFNFLRTWLCCRRFSCNITPYFCRKLGNMSQNLSSAAVVIGALRVKLVSGQLYVKWYILAVTCGFQQYGILTRLNSDQPVQPPFKLSKSKWCLAKSLTVVEYSSDKQRL